MKVAYFDCFSGISGDMFIGALLDAGLDFESFRNELIKLNLKGYELEARRVVKNGISGTKFSVIVTEWGVERHIKDITDIIDSSFLDDDIKGFSKNVFLQLASVEAKIHGVSEDQVHFHEIGGMDSIVDIVGAFVALKLMGIEKIFSSKIHLGEGFTESMHGTIPVPAPATVELLKGIPVYSRGIQSELATPTGAALISFLAESFGPMPEVKVISTGYGAGSKELEIPNLLRTVIGEMVDIQQEIEDIVMIETNIDDMNPEIYEYVSDRLFGEGALDVYIIPIIMKKSRPGSLLNVLIEKKHLDKIADIIFQETTTAGVRIKQVERRKLDREIAAVETEYGNIKVKVLKSKGNIVTVSPEYEDCKIIARKTGISIKQVYAIAKSAFEKK